MPKHAVRIPARKVDRRVRWMLEVSADVGEGTVRTEKASRKHTRSKSAKKAPRESVSRKKPITGASAHTPPTAPTSIPVPPPAVSVGTASANAKRPSAGTGVSGREIAAVAAVGILVVGAAVALMGYPSLRVASVFQNEQPVPPAPRIRVGSADRPAPLAAAINAASQARVQKAIVEKPKPTPPAKPRSAEEVAVPSTPLAMASVAVVNRSELQTVPADSITSAPIAASTAAPDVSSQTVTISGCLEMTVDEDQFRLADTEGAGAPKGRSWRSGFLKKRSSPVELVGLSDPATFRQHVGHRVMATGVLSGRQLRVRSLQPEGSACD